MGGGLRQRYIDGARRQAGFHRLRLYGHAQHAFGVVDGSATVGAPSFLGLGDTAAFDASSDRGSELLDDYAELAQPRRGFGLRAIQEIAERRRPRAQLASV